MIPAEKILIGPNPENFLMILTDGLVFVPRLVEIMHPEDQAKLSYYNKNSLESDLNDDNLQEEIIKLELTKEKSIDLNNLKNEYAKFSKDLFSHNRFQSVNSTIIPGVGVDGSGYHPLNWTRENLVLSKIEEEATNMYKWNPNPGDGEEFLKESVKNVCFWQACNIAQFPIGSPVEVCSAVLELLSPLKNRETTDEHVEFLDSFNGKDFIINRPEILGLRYFIDGNMFNIEDRSIIIKGIRDFENQKFVRFGRNGIGSKGEASVKIFLVTDVNKDATIPTNTVLFQYDKDPSTTPATEFKMINSDLRKILINTITDTPITGKKTDKRVAILFLFTIFFEYACYIFNLYEEKLISKLKKTSKNIVDQLRRANFTMISNFILLINYSLIRKFKIKHKDGEFYDARDFIGVDQCASDTEKFNNLTYTKVIRRICSDRIKLSTNSAKPTIKENNIRIYFTREKSYSDDNFFIDENEFTLDNFPIVFDTNLGVEKAVFYWANETFLYVNYRRSIERLTNFLLQNNNGEIPKTNDGKIIAIGAPMQNDEVFEQTFESLDGYYDYIKGSKQIYKQFAELKLAIYRSGYPSKDIIENFNYFISKFNIIFSTYRNPQKQEIELLKIISYVMNKYKKYRKQELKLMDNKIIFENNSKRVIGDKMYDIAREEYYSILSVKAGLSAEMIVKIAELSYNIYIRRNPVGTASNFLNELKQKRTLFDNEVDIETKKILQKQQIEINRRFGKGSIKQTMQTIGLNNLPPTPPQFLQMFSGLSSPMAPISQGTQIGAPTTSGKVNLSLENRLKIENLKFWQDLRTIFSGRTLYLPVVKLDSRNKFDDNGFYLINILTSMIFNKISAIKISNNGVVSRKALDSYVLNNGYILLSTNTVDLSNPNSWRCVNYKNLSKFKKTNGQFKDIKKVRGVFFNLIANNLTLTEYLNISIPAGSNISNGLVKYCSNILKKELQVCNILISRQQFAQTVYPKQGSLTGTTGIDLISGTAYYEHGNYTQSRNSEIVIR
jgi:hypothetical protein